MGIFGLTKASEAPPASVPRGHRAYVIGDVHGRLDLLEQLLAQIENETERHPPRKALIVFLGDLIDRGPHSAQVVERLRTFRSPRIQPIFLLGNHEEVLLRILDGDTSIIPSWLQFGGAQCIQSYGVDPRKLAGRGEEEILAIVRAAVPAEHRSFIGSFVDTCRLGDYLFVHAGIRPGVPIEEQLQSDLRWIREPFLRDETDHGCVVVHGHTITADVEERRNRIGIDTGAYRTGVLTALVLEGSERRYIDTKARAATPA